MTEEEFDILLKKAFRHYVENEFRDSSKLEKTLVSQTSETSKDDIFDGVGQLSPPVQK